MNTTKSGYLYVLVHPSDPNLVKVGITIRKPEERLAQHNSCFEEYTGQIVKRTGQKWELKEYFSVPDPAYAEAVFWEMFSPGPFKAKGIEVMHTVEYERVRGALDIATKVGMRPSPKPRIKPVRNREWMINQLEGTGITMIGTYRGLVTGVEFQCVRGHTFKQSAGLVANRKMCPLCEQKRPL